MHKPSVTATTSNNTASPLLKGMCGIQKNIHEKLSNALTLFRDDTAMCVYDQLLKFKWIQCKKRHFRFLSQTVKIPTVCSYFLSDHLDMSFLNARTYNNHVDCVVAQGVKSNWFYAEVKIYLFFSMFVLWFSYTKQKTLSENQCIMLQEQGRVAKEWTPHTIYPLITTF